MANRFIQLLKFYFSAKTVFGVKSPFLIDFCKNILEDERHFYAFSELSYLRSQLKKNNHEVSVNDFGAGSRVLNKRVKKVSSIAKTSGTSPFFAKVLFKIVLHFQPEKILELGTSMGLGTLYMSKAREQSRVFTVEGCPNVASWAKHHFKWAKVDNIKLTVGEFEKQLPGVLELMKTVDLAFIDGNHRKAPTIEYFEKCLQRVNENTILIFDDIYWSSEMIEAWEQIKLHPAVGQSIDLYQFGIIFLKKNNNSEKHIKLVPARWKPWTKIFS